MTILRWFISQEARNAAAMRKHIRRILSAQRDVLTPQAIENVNRALADLTGALDSGAKGDAVKKEMGKSEQAANKWLKPYPHAAWRENVEVLLVALTVAMAIRTFFVQPFKIPTGSMQPTLFGVTSEPDFSPSKIDFSADRAKIEAQISEQAKLRNALVIPTGWERLKEWFQGVSYIHVIAQADGEIEMGQMRHFLIFNLKQTLSIGGVEQTIWFPPDFGEQPIEKRAGLFLDPHHIFHKGEDVFKMKVGAGDHLFVDRLTYNFRKPARGEIIVFETAGIPEDMRDRYHIPADEFYIKRLVALPGEKVSIGDDRHIRINGRRLDASTPHFENLYGFDPAQPPRESQFSGHLNGAVAQKYGLMNVAELPQFPDEEAVYDVPANSCMPMGDNTCNSLDSRFWGAIPEDYVIGKSFFVYWPLTKRFGWGNQ
ncbi:MAG TPA: signal peptidase I [Verrucomicrobiae bacterium]|jgi:signal peptidase I|nr:signal peptidase I [Verrucomicrobiae bacterium]